MSEQHRKTFDGFSDSVVVGGLTERLIWNNDVPFNQHISPNRNASVSQSNGGNPAQVKSRRLQLDFSPGTGVASRGYSEHAAKMSGSLPPSRVKEQRLSRRSSESPEYMEGFELSSLFTNKAFRAQTSPVSKRTNCRIPPTSHSSQDAYRKVARRFSTGSYPLFDDYGLEDIFLNKDNTVINLKCALEDTFRKKDTNLNCGFLEPSYKSEICSNAQFREDEIVMNVLQNSHPKALRQFLLSVPDVAVKTLLFESPRPTGCNYLSKQILGYLVGPLNTEKPMTDDQRLRLLYIAGKQAQILVRSSVLAHHCNEKGTTRRKRCNCLEHDYAFSISQRKARSCLGSPDKRKRKTKSKLSARAKSKRPSTIDMPIKSASEILPSIPEPPLEKCSPPTNIKKTEKSNPTSRTKLDSFSEVSSISISRQPTTSQKNDSGASKKTVNVPVIKRSDYFRKQRITPIVAREIKVEETKRINNGNQINKRNQPTLPLSEIGFGKKFVIPFAIPDKPVVTKKLPPLVTKRLPPPAQSENLNKPSTKTSTASAISFRDFRMMKPKKKDKKENARIKEPILEEFVTKDESLRLWNTWLLPPQTFISRKKLP